MSSGLAPASHLTLNSEVDIAPHRWSDGFDAALQLKVLHQSYTIHGLPREGVVSIARNTGEGKRPWHEFTLPVYHISDLPDRTDLPKWFDVKASNVYVSQQCFWRWRAVSQLKELGCLYVDLDYRTRSRWAETRPDDVAWAAMRSLDEDNLPTPTYIIATGRGLCAVWLHEYVPRAALPRWNAAQKVLADALTRFGADKRAVDAARVFRLLGSTNPRAVDSRYETVKCIYAAGDPVRLRKAHGWSFDSLCDQILPLTRAELEDLRANRAKRNPKNGDASAPARILTKQTYAETILTDLQRLRKLRYGDGGGLPAGHRDTWLFFAACAMAYLSTPVIMRREVLSLAREAGWSAAEARSRLGTVMRRAEDAYAGKTVTDLNGRAVDARYLFKSNTIVESLEITSSEMQSANLRVLIDQDRRRQLNTERTRESRHRRGAKPRYQARTERLELGHRARWRSIRDGEPLWFIAKDEGVSLAQLKKAMREARQEKS